MQTSARFAYNEYLPDNDSETMYSHRMVSIGEELYAVLPGTARQKLAVAILPVAAAGACGLWYVTSDGGWVALFAYASCLCLALVVLHPLGKKLEYGSAENGKDCASGCNFLSVETALIECRDAASSEIPEKKLERVGESARKTGKMAGSGQHVLDLDGMNALRAMHSIGGDWLIEEATDIAVNAVRASCLARLSPDDLEHARIQRWFEIVLALKGADKKALPKAELRRSYVAQEMGVSEEQIRQIDQGRYLPLNKVLAKVNPKVL